MKVDNVQEAIERINKWQNSEITHPLTCSNDSQNHRSLIPESKDGELILACPDCSYIQYQIPPMCLDDSLDQWESTWAKLLSKMNQGGE